jgi:hypothetical protein
VQPTPRPALARVTACAIAVAGLGGVSVGCGGGAPAAPTLGWLDRLADRPDELGALFEATPRDAWIAWHEHRYADAWSALGATSSVAASRAALDEALVHHDLAAVTREATLSLVDGWRALPPDSHARLVAWLAAPPEARPARAAELPEAVRAWTAGGPAPAWLAPVVQRWIDAERPLTGDAGGSAFDLRWSGEPTRALAEPMLVDADGHRWWDPMSEAALAEGWAARARTGPPDDPWNQGGDGLAAWLFSPWLDAGDLAVAVASARAACAPIAPLTRADACEAAVLLSANPAPDRISPFVDPAVPPPSTTPSATAGGAVSTSTGGVRPEDAARAEARRVQQRGAREALSRWTLALADRPGAAVVTDLQLADRLRQRWAVDRARAELDAGHCAAAQALLEPAMDVTSRGVGPSNAPSLFAVLARARLMCGRSREALDALRVLADARPHARAAYEVVADLAVLRGIHRAGDSREE